MAAIPSAKRAMINKANSTIVAVTAGAAFVVIFCAVAAYILLGQLSYQNRVIGANKDALNQLKTDLASTEQLVKSYKGFVSTSQNVLGGNPAGSGPQDGDNAKIVLDALPSKYDFPALATSLEKLANQENVAITAIGGTDDEVAQSTATSSATPVPIPFQLSVSGNYDHIKQVVGAFQDSIRPFQIQTLQLTGSESKMTLAITAQTFYQPEKTLQIQTEVVK